MFGKDKERIRQWGLLGQLLRGLPLLQALDFMGRAFGPSAVAWLAIREKAAGGMALSELAEGPKELLDALRTGEKDGRVPELLAELLPEEEGVSPSAADAAAVVLVDRFLAEAVEKGLERTTVPDSFVPAARRRLWVMAGQAYWAPKPGSFRMRMPKGDVGFRISPEPGGGIALELSRSPGKG